MSSKAHYNLALLAHLIYLARRTESAQQQHYLERAASVIEEMQHHPKLREGACKAQGRSVSYSRPSASSSTRSRWSISEASSGWSYEAGKFAVRPKAHSGPVGFAAVLIAF
jgi:hypothetical protein